MISSQITGFSEEEVKSSKAGASSLVTITLVREEAAGRVSDLGEKGASVTQRNGIKESKQMGRCQPWWWGWAVGGALCGISWRERDLSFCR